MYSLIFLSPYFMQKSAIGQCMFTIQRFFSTERTEKSVQCSELGGVHLAEVHLQQKSIGGTESSVQVGGVHYREVFINRGFTVYYNLLLIVL
jgi:hypothetical protein